MPEENAHVSQTDANVMSSSSSSSSSISGPNSSSGVTDDHVLHSYEQIWKTRLKRDFQEADYSSFKSPQYLETIYRKHSARVFRAFSSSAEGSAALEISSLANSFLKAAPGTLSLVDESINFWVSRLFALLSKQNGSPYCLRKLCQLFSCYLQEPSRDKLYEQLRNGSSSINLSPVVWSMLFQFPLTSDAIAQALMLEKPVLTPWQNSLWHWALSIKHEQAIAQLQNDARAIALLTQTNYQNENALHYAIAFGHHSLVEWMLMQPNAQDLIAKKSKIGQSPLHFAAMKGNAEMVRLLLTRGADVHGLVDVTSEDWDDYVESRIHAGTPLHLAARNGSAEIVALLLEAGAAIDFEDSHRVTPLIIAILANHPRVIDVLIAHQANLTLGPIIFDVDDFSGKSMMTSAPIQLAAEMGQLETVKKLLAAGVPVDQQDSNGFTALHSALAASQTEIAMFLIGLGADVNAITEDKETPLDMLKDQEMIKPLLEAGADPHLPTGENGETPIHRIAKSHTLLLPSLTYWVPSLFQPSYSGNTSGHSLLQCPAERHWEGPVPHG